MCGNGIRCVAKFVHDRGIARKNQLTIETGRGILTLDLEIKNGKVERVRVDMGTPILEAEHIPATLPGPRVIDHRLAPDEADQLSPWFRQAGVEPRLTCVSTGNPHVILFCPDVSAVPLESVGPALETAPIFPKRINVHFAQVLGPGEVRMRTWERGSGITLACGTGACSVCVAGVLTNRTGRTLLAHLPGGDLTLEWPSDQSSVFMTGPATEVFQGTWPDA
jgi:diaminopimelate epimerase